MLCEGMENTGPRSPGKGAIRRAETGSYRDRNSETEDSKSAVRVKTRIFTRER